MEIDEERRREREKNRLVDAAVRCVQQLLFPVDPHLYSLERVRTIILAYPELSGELFSLFLLRFHPKKRDLIEYERALGAYTVHMERSDLKEVARTVFNTLLACLTSLLKTNFFARRKGALSFRFAGSLLGFSETPYALFFIWGRTFFGFHIRFQDVARGGLRTIIGTRKEELPILTECYELALTQQRKNKDIPEGGAKGIIFLNGARRLKTGTDSMRVRLYSAQRLFVESLMSLINTCPDGTLKDATIIDYWGKPEHLYLGPDENMHDSMIIWIAAYAKKVGYPPGVAFISSKPEIGINHKQYGVTSLGVNVCVDEVLRFVGINPEHDLFTVKMSGGPDGDVAGNELLNLYRYYPKTAQLVTLMDISGVIYDSRGVDLARCEALFFKGQGIAHYDPEALTEGGFLLDRVTKGEGGVCLWKRTGGALVQEWISEADARDICCHTIHRTPADLFIPAGGRPHTLNEGNIADFFDDKGHPTAKAIVEGANLYLSLEARARLERSGVIIIKDSSANKGGVICSSFEVLLGLVLSEEEFLRQKEEIVLEILKKLRWYATAEVRLILLTHTQTGKPCSEISGALSAKIDTLRKEMQELLQGAPLLDRTDPLATALFAYALPFIARDYPGRLLVLDDAYKKAIIAAWIASHAVYLHGLEWEPHLASRRDLAVLADSIIEC